MEYEDVEIGKDYLLRGTVRALILKDDGLMEVGVAINDGARSCDRRFFRYTEDREKDGSFIYPNAASPRIGDTVFVAARCTGPHEFSFRENPAVLYAPFAGFDPPGVMCPVMFDDIPEPEDIEDITNMEKAVARAEVSGQDVAYAMMRGDVLLNHNEAPGEERSEAWWKACDEIREKLPGVVHALVDECVEKALSQNPATGPRPRP